jgi:hypothetical protein
VRIDLDHDGERPYLCTLAGGAERGRGRTVLHAAVACWAEVLESLRGYTRRGFTDLERFLLDPDMA